MTIYEQFYGIIRQIPRGRVATYGQIARLAGFPTRARQVGYALAALSSDDVPWHRVINHKGEVSPRAEPFSTDQRARLEHEGVIFDAQARVALSRYLWNPKGRG